MKTVNIETTSLSLTFDRETGSLVNLYSKLSDWNIFNRPNLALSWQLMLPLEGRRNNNAWGHKQKTSPTCEIEADLVRFRWNTVESEYGGVHNISVTTECHVEDNQAVLRMHIENNDNVIVENVYYPCIGDLHRPSEAEQFSLYHGTYFRTDTVEMWPTYQNYAGTHSVDFPTLTITGSDSPPFQPYVLAADEKGNGLYMGVAERRIEVVSWHGEAHPGWRNSNDFRLFTEDFAEGHEVYNRFCLGHLPFIVPNTSFDLLPLAFEAYKGSWAEGSKCYTRISKKWNKLPKMPEWAKHPHSWIQVHINSPEDELRMRFTELPRLGIACKKYGIDAIQLVGWNNGGQDRGNPSHDPDPRLGTFEELKQAISEIHSMGIKLILFAKFTWADQSHPNFKTVYEPLSIKDPYGNYYMMRGYQYQTLSQMTNVNTRRLVPMCFHSDKYMEICRNEFQKCVDLGADGILYDENHHHAHALCCFDEGHGHRYGESVYSADERLITMFREMTADKDFLIAGEASYDFQLNYYDVSYARTWGRDHRAYSRMNRPNANLMTAVIGFNDRSLVNQCLLNRYIISYEPFNFKGLPSDFPATVTYGMKMDKLRTELREYFWDGTFNDTIGGTVTIESTGEIFRDYAVYHAANGKQGMVICNYDEEKAVVVVPKLTSDQTLEWYSTVEDEVPTPFTGSITLAPLSAAVVY